MACIKSFGTSSRYVLFFLELPKDVTTKVLCIDIVEQFLMSVKLLIARERVTAPHAITIWALIQRTLRGPSTAGAGPKPPHAHLGFALMGEFEEWLTRRSESMEKRHRVALCVYGMISTFKPAINPLSVWVDYAEAVSLVRALDGYLSELGGGAAFLTHSIHQQWQVLAGALNNPAEA